MLLAFIAFYFMMYAGVFLLAFWGADWTRDTAIMYLKALLARSIEFYGIILLASASSDIFQNCLNDFVSSSGADTWLPLATLFTAAVVTYLLITKLPAMLAQCVAPIQSAGVSASGFAAATGLAAAAGMMMGAAKMIAKSVGSGAVSGAANTARAAGRAAMGGTFGAGIQTVANQAYGMGQGIAHGMTAVGEFFGKNPGGATRASLRRGFESRGIDSANAKNLAADAHDRMVRSGMTKDEAMDYSFSNFAGRSSGRESSENSISGSGSNGDGGNGSDGGGGGSGFSFANQSGVDGVERTQNAMQQGNNADPSSSASQSNSTYGANGNSGATSTQSGVNGVERTQNAKMQNGNEASFADGTAFNSASSPASQGFDSSNGFANNNGSNGASAQSTSASNNAFSNQSGVNGVLRTQNAQSSTHGMSNSGFAGSNFARGNLGSGSGGSSHIPGGLSSGLGGGDLSSQSSRGSFNNDPYDPSNNDYQRTMMNRADVDLNGSGQGNGQGDPVSQSYWSSNV